MSDLERAKLLLYGGIYTCVLCRDDEIITSTERGVAPMLKNIENNVDLKGFSAADKVIGKAAAILFHIAGITVLYGGIMSRAAAEYLEKTDISFSYGILTDKIINRRGDGLCPMETAVCETDDPYRGLELIKTKYNELRKAQK